MPNNQHTNVALTTCQRVCISFGDLTIPHDDDDNADNADVLTPLIQAVRLSGLRLTE